MSKLYALSLLALSVSPTWALTTVNYNTTGSVLSCNGVAGWVQNTATSVSIGGLSLTYNTGSGSGMAAPSFINFGNLVSTGTSDGVSLTGLLLNLNVNSTPPRASGIAGVGTVSGSMGANFSTAQISFASASTTSIFGTMPGVVIGSGTNGANYQVVQTLLALQAPTVGNPIGQTSIQGTVSAVPEPSTALMMVMGVAGLGAARLRKRAA
jgi:hypothetical protein